MLAISGALMLIIIGALCYSTYTVAWMLNVARLPKVMVPAVLAVSGIAGALGLIVTTRIADRNPTAALYSAITAVACSFLVLPLAVSSPALVVCAMLIFGLTWGTISTLLQAATMRTSSVEGRGLAAAVQTTAINVGIGCGALLGGALIGVIGLHALPAAAGILVLVGGVVIVGLDRRWRLIGGHPKKVVERSSCESL